jgi:hypothetical protein
VLDVGKAWKDVAHAEGVHGERRKDPEVRGQGEAESHREELAEGCNEL